MIEFFFGFSETCVSTPAALEYSRPPQKQPPTDVVKSSECLLKWIDAKHGKTCQRSSTPIHKDT
jgi:hypothetical protein